MGTYVVTGASTGIGRACALWLDRRGHTVFGGVRKQADADALTERASDRFRPVFLDVTDEAGITAAGATVADAVGEAGLDGLVNNAGIAVPGPLEYVDSNELRKQLEVNVVGQMAVTRQFLPLIRISAGRLVFMSSVAGFNAVPFLGPYAASKHAIEALANSLRMELRPWGIRVAVVEPGTITTPIWEKGLSAADTLTESLDAEGHALYDGAIDAARRAVEATAEAGVPPVRVAKAVEHALTARRPKTRYLVGPSARAQFFLSRFMPDRARDRLISSQMNLPK